MYCAQGLLQGSSLKKKSVSGGSFIRGKSVKEELKQHKNYIQKFKFSLRNHTGSFVLLLKNISLFVSIFCRT